ncbi:hypothetical protein [Burkholderia sp. B21-007]|uniref:hypothetical protein n=1 Tax=Burkholderia sp. B21-007 TaxID=2890407 RepID=UPI001E3E9633|nr:hypothetical protein [Burkholderia sp. B21-007]UEP31607.1 hypothetical protein LMA01_20585 [Burkholderia sp. B21-007]
MSDEVKEDAAPSSTEPVQAVEQLGEQSAVASDAAESSPVESVSATPVSTDAGSSQPVASSLAEALTFEQRVEQRFLQVEAFIVKLPYSIAHALHQGSGSVEELAQRAIAHLFGKDQ